MSDHHLSDEQRLNSWQWTVTVWLHPLPGHTHVRIHIHEYAPSVLTAHTHLTSPSITHTPTQSPSFPLGDRLQVPCPPRGPRRALVRPGAIQAAPNTQLRVLCVSLTALVILFMWKKKKERRTSEIIALKKLTEPQDWEPPCTYVRFKGIYQCFFRYCPQFLTKSHIPAFYLHSYAFKLATNFHLFHIFSKIHL